MELHLNADDYAIVHRIDHDSAVLILHALHGNRDILPFFSL